MKFPASNEYLARLSSIGHAKELLTSEGYSVIASERCGRLQADLMVDPADLERGGIGPVAETLVLKMARALLREGIVKVQVRKNGAENIVSGELLIIRPESK